MSREIISSFPFFFFCRLFVLPPPLSNIVASFIGTNYFMSINEFMIYGLLTIQTHITPSFPASFLPRFLLESDISVCQLPYGAHYGSCHLMLAVMQLGTRVCLCVLSALQSKKEIKNVTVMLPKPADVRINLSSRKFQFSTQISTQIIRFSMLKW